MKLYKADYSAGTIEEVEGEMKGKWVKLDGLFCIPVFAEYFDTKEAALDGLLLKRAERVEQAVMAYQNAQEELEEANEVMAVTREYVQAQRETQ